MRIRREMAPSTMNTMYTVEMITVHIAPNKNTDSLMFFFDY